ncbi:hypothetical protein BC749_104223 [Flavobacterium araucananum]|jgi:hypothetical protein|nr:hypothetical protein BC749_104223 [Flavobacterium araucananum]
MGKKTDIDSSTHTKVNKFANENEDVLEANKRF